jgi:biotin carboxylase
MIEAGVPCVPGSVGILESYEQAPLSRNLVFQ